MKMYVVGGFVRDEILGVKSKDVDFSVTLDGLDLRRRRPTNMDMPYTPVEPFKIMVENLRFMGFKIFLETPEHLTVRAMFPKGSTAFGGIKDADFVLARKEGTYSDGRRPDSVEIGTLHDDLARRDFTMNAIAKDEDGSYIDPFNGRADIDARIIRAVGDPVARLTEDALRAVRAIRFAVTKGFAIDRDLAVALHRQDVVGAVADKISDERIAVEVSKMFRYDTVKSIRLLSNYPALTAAMFKGSVSLDSTMKLKGRGK